MPSVGTIWWCGLTGVLHGVEAVTPDSVEYVVMSGRCAGRRAWADPIEWRELNEPA